MNRNCECKEALEMESISNEFNSVLSCNNELHIIKSPQDNNIITIEETQEHKKIGKIHYVMYLLVVIGNILQFAARTFYTADTSEIFLKSLSSKEEIDPVTSIIYPSIAAVSTGYIVLELRKDGIHELVFYTLPKIFSIDRMLSSLKCKQNIRKTDLPFYMALFVKAFAFLFQGIILLNMIPILLFCDVSNAKTLKKISGTPSLTPIQEWLSGFLVFFYGIQYLSFNVVRGMENVSDFRNYMLYEKEGIDIGLLVLTLLLTSFNLMGNFFFQIYFCSDLLGNPEENLPSQLPFGLQPSTKSAIDNWSCLAASLSCTSVAISQVPSVYHILRKRKQANLQKLIGESHKEELGNNEEKDKLLKKWFCRKWSIYLFGMIDVSSSGLANLKGTGFTCNKLFNTSEQSLVILFTIGFISSLSSIVTSFAFSIHGGFDKKVNLKLKNESKSRYKHASNPATLFSNSPDLDDEFEAPYIKMDDSQYVFTNG